MHLNSIYKIVESFKMGEKRKKKVYGRVALKKKCLWFSFITPSAHKRNATNNHLKIKIQLYFGVNYYLKLSN